MDEKKPEKKSEALATQAPKFAVPIVDGVVAPDSLDGLWRMCGIVIASKLAPKGIDTTEKAVICAAAGMSVGLNFFQSLQSVAPINGIPSIYGDAALALVRSHGDNLEDFYERIARYCPDCRPEDETEILASHKAKKCGGCNKALDDDTTAAVCYSKRRTMPRGRLSAFSIADAKKARLWGKGGPWTDMPNRMLMFRARSFNLRDNFGDILKGLVTVEEAMDRPIDMTPAPGGGWEAPQAMPSGLVPVAGTVSEQSESAPATETPAAADQGAGSVSPQPEAAPPPEPSCSPAFTSAEQEAAYNLMSTEQKIQVWRELFDGVDTTEDLMAVGDRLTLAHPKRKDKTPDPVRSHQIVQQAYTRAAERARKAGGGE